MYHTNDIGNRNMVQEGRQLENKALVSSEQVRTLQGT